MAPRSALTLLRAPTGLSSAPEFFHEFEIPSGHGALVSAQLDVTAEGIVEPRIDGRPATHAVLVPGWTSYEWRLRVASFDVTALLRQPGETHELSLLVGNGWFSGRLGWMGARAVYGERPGAAAELRLSFADGTVRRVVTDDAWEVRGSTVRSDDLYDGETIDLASDPSPAYPALAERVAPGRLVSGEGPPIVRHESIAPVSVTTSADGGTLFDFGQNIVGWLRVRVTGPRGHRLVATHAEVLVDGRLATSPLRSARATDVFVLSGGDDVLEPTLTFHGFRYAHISGWCGLEGDVEAVVVGSELRRTGTFACSDELLNRFHANVVWSLRGNTVGIPSDCPQRDERLGWTGDIAVFAPTACFLFDMTGFLGDWLADLRAEQDAAGGRVPYVVPDPLKGWAVRPGQQPESTAVWSDAAVWVPWALWEATADLEVLATSYASMVAHVERVLGRLSPRGVWEGDFQFGDWLDPSAPPDDPTAAVADPDVIATCALHLSLIRVAATAELLGRSEEGLRWTSHAAHLRHAFARAYLDPDGRIASDAPAVYALAIVSGVLDAEALDAAGDRLAELVCAAGHTIAAGFAGAPYLCDALTRTGHIDDAYALLFNRTSPSWLHPVLLGATTVWERWDSMREDGSLNPGEMTSFNHYALGAVADWMHRTIIGLAPAEPGYARVRIDPRPGGGLTWGAGSLESARGFIGVHWRTNPEDLVAYCVPEGVDIDLGEFALRAGRRVSEEHMRELLARSPHSEQI